MAAFITLTMRLDNEPMIINVDQITTVSIARTQDGMEDGSVLWIGENQTFYVKESPATVRRFMTLSGAKVIGNG